MDKQQAQQTIKDTFESSFDKSRFAGFIKNLLNKIEDAPFTYRGKYIPDAYKQYIKTLERVGKFSDGENRIDILIVTLQKDTSLERARTMQRNFIAQYLNGSRGGVMKDGALVAFVSPEAADWRFSLVKMDYKFEKIKTGRMKVKEEFTPARRWSFLVGANEKSHTAQSRLFKILANDEQAPTLEEIEKAFDIETVTKEFFLKYRELFLRTKEALDRVVKNDPKIKADFEAKGVDTVNFAKKLLGQIIFLYFLQKKGWFGVGRDDDWGTGSKHFLRQLFEKKHSDYKNFYNDILEPLFYEALRIDRSHVDGYYSRFNCKIPFLNGGLFDPIGNYDWVHTDIIIPDELFSNTRKTKEGDIGNGILDVFDRYNFTVKEDEPLEKEVAIDPELLGKAYEKFNAIRPDNYDEFRKALKSGRSGEENKFNKKFGVYYTPREIVHYMCQQSLINYLHTEVIASEAKQSLIPSKEDIEILIHIGEQVSEIEARVISKGRETETYSHKLSESIRKNAALIDQKLADITVCDPAVGSGAFPVGMMSEIVRARNVLRPFLFSQGKTQPTIVIASGAKQSQSYDNRTPYEFKRRCIEHSLYGVDIDPGAVEIAKLRLWLSLVVDEDDIKIIKPLPNLDYKVVCGNSLLGVEKNLFNLNLFNELEKLKPRFFNETNPTKKQEYKKQIDTLINEITSGHKEFDFEVYFSEVFHEKGGFDVVIANPPYVRHETISEMTPILRKRFTVGASRADLLIFFFEQGVNLLRPGGVLTLITSNKFHRAAYGSKLRPYLTEKIDIQVLIDFGDAPVFEAIAYASIFIGTKGKAAGDHSIRACMWPPASSFTGLEQTLEKVGLYLVQSDLTADGWCIESPEAIRLLEKLRSKGTPLGDYVNGRLHRGIITGLNEAFVIDCATRNRLIREDKRSAELIKPFLRGRDVKRWTAHHQDLYLIVFPFGFHKKLKEYPAILRHLSQFEDKLKKRGQCTSSRGNKKCGQHHWLELDNNPKEEYLALHGRQKLIYPELAAEPRFSFDYQGFAVDCTLYFIPDASLFLAAYMNCLIVRYIIRLTSAVNRGGYVRFKKQYVESVPIPPASSANKLHLTKLAERAVKLAAVDNVEGVQKTEREIDQLVYKLYDLTPEEIKIVEGKI